MAISSHICEHGISAGESEEVQRESKPHCIVNDMIDSVHTISVLTEVQNGLALRSERGFAHAVKIGYKRIVLLSPDRQQELHKM